MTTHLLRIPLATKISRPILSKSLAAVMAERAAAQIPFDAWRSVDQLSIPLGTMKLRSTEDIFDAKSLLAQMDISGLVKILRRELRAKRESAIASNQASDRISGEAMPTPSLEEQSISLQVSLRGLKPSSRHEHMLAVTGLVGQIEGNEKALAHLRRQLSLLFAKYKSKQAMTRSKSENLTVGIMSSYQLQTKTHVSKELDRSLRLFDVRQLCDENQDIVWAKNVCLEKICLSEIALKDFYENGQVIARAAYRDLASIALPGAPTPDFLIKQPQQSYSPARLITDPPEKAKKDPYFEGAKRFSKLLLDRSSRNY